MLLKTALSRNCHLLFLNSWSRAFDFAAFKEFTSRLLKWCRKPHLTMKQESSFKNPYRWTDIAYWLWSFAMSTLDARQFNDVWLLNLQTFIWNELCCSTLSGSPPPVQTNLCEQHFRATWVMMRLGGKLGATWLWVIISEDSKGDSMPAWHAVTNAGICLTWSDLADDV